MKQKHQPEPVGVFFGEAQGGGANVGDAALDAASRPIFLTLPHLYYHLMHSPESLFGTRRYYVQSYHDWFE